MATKTRLANKTIWALESILAKCLGARRTWLEAMERAKKRDDAVMMAHLAHLRDDMAEIQRLAQDARAGRYDEQIKLKGDG